MNLGISCYGSIGFDILTSILASDKRPEFVLTKSDNDYSESVKIICDRFNIKFYIDIDMNSDEFRDILKEHNITLYYMLWYSTILKSETINSVSDGIVNIHPSMLPHNRGMHPWYWNVIENCPFGASLHFIDEKIDNGKIIAQQEINIDMTDTGESIYSKLSNVSKKLFKDNHLKIISGDIKPFNQPQGGSFHYGKELDKHSEIKLESEYKAIDLINIMRARSFENGNSSFFYKDGQKYEINIKIKKVDE